MFIKMEYDEISDAFIRANLAGSPAELHGYLTGAISGGEVFSEVSLVTTIASFLEVESERVEDLGDMLIDLYQFSVDQIRSSDFEFLPVLPDDDFSLSERLASLGEWCQGFLYGLGQSEALSNTKISGDIAEALDDIAAISHIQISSVKDENDNSDSEANYTELVEYIKVAVLTIFGELDENCVTSSASVH